jgi:UDP-N-acetylmuramate--alanine ligase
MPSPAGPPNRFAPPDRATAPRLNPAWHYHLLGIGGVGLSAVAEMMHRRGLRVSGSDAKEGPLLERLRGLGIAVRIGHPPEALDGVDAVIYTPAVQPAHPIWAEVARRGLPRLHRVEALAALTERTTTLAVAGTHGKTTTTAALGCALIAAGLDPTVLVGGQVPQFGGSNVRAGGGPDNRAPWWVVEADESDGSFVHLSPRAILVTNIEADHLDHHGSLEQVDAAFRAFVKRLDPARGLLVSCADDPAAKSLFHPGRTITYGVDPAATVRVSVGGMRPGAMALEFSQAERSWSLTSRLVGRHNALNLAGAFALALGLDLPEAAVLEGLAGFAGVERRQQYLGQAAGLSIFDDYAHHPTEIRATLELFLSVYGPPVTVVFQPHLYSRTAHFAAEFAAALRPATRVYVTDVYGAREAPLPGVSGRLIADGLAGHAAAAYVPSWEELVPRLLAGEAPPGLLLTMGAGDITGLGPRLLQARAAPAQRERL